MVTELSRPALAERALSYSYPADRARRENFPVAGWFIARPLRPAVRAYYAFARAADDIADAPDLTVIAKLQGLDALAADLAHASHPVAVMLRARGLPIALAADLLQAFRADARNGGIATLSDLMSYCRSSACPVGRFLLALHGEVSGTQEADALSSALQILNHVQDVRGDAAELRRCYVPADWLADAGVDAGRLVTAPPETAPAGLTAALRRMLDQAEDLLVLAGPLPHALANRRLAAQSAAILCLAWRLLGRLRRADPWRYAIGLTPLDWAAAALAGARRWAWGR